MERHAPPVQPSPRPSSCPYFCGRLRMNLNRIQRDAKVGTRPKCSASWILPGLGPSLAFVMAGAIAVGALAFGLANRRAVSFLGAGMRLPPARHIDRRLVLGSVRFGIGWGVAGFCPGPALVFLGMGEGQGARLRGCDAGGHGRFRAFRKPRARALEPSGLKCKKP